MSTSTILVCGARRPERDQLVAHFHERGYSVVLPDEQERWIDAVSRTAPDAVVLEIPPPAAEHLQALHAMVERGLGLPVVVTTPDAGVEGAIAATRLGAVGYYQEPVEPKTVLQALERAIHSRWLAHQLHDPAAHAARGYGDIIGDSAAMRSLFDTLRRIESVDPSTILIQGESGTGKDLVARTIHERGPRRAGPYVEIDCTALPEHLLESELFGHERGAFTDARVMKRGLFEVAAGGVVFLDEVGELPLGMQAKLLRALENRRFRRVGGVTDIHLDASVIAATNKRLQEEVAGGRFREDLFFRLHVLPIEVPPLRDRRGDIPLLVDLFVQRFSQSFGRQVIGISEAALQVMEHHRWPGNIRELRNVVERTVILLPGDVIQPADLPPEVRARGRAQYARGVGSDLIELPEEGVDLEAVERSLVAQALERAHGSRTGAAHLLGITRFAVLARVKKFGLESTGKDRDNDNS